MSAAHKPVVRLGRAGLELDDGSRVPLWSGAMHYWRVPRPRWGSCLDAIVDLGFPMVESYVPWGVHEVRKGRYDWSGNRDLGAFVAAAAERGLRVLLRPGPHINAELLYFGFPERIVADVRFQARTARDTPAYLPAPPSTFPVPSYACDRFFREVAGWFDAFAEVAAALVYPDGPVVGLQVDNEMGFFFRTGAYDLDYASDALLVYRDFITARYGGDVQALRDAYEQPEIEFETLDPPRRWDSPAFPGLRRHLDWMGSRAHYLRRALGLIADLLRERGFGRVPLFHNYPPGDGRPPFDYAGAERVLDLVGTDLYHSRREYRTVKRRLLALAGSSRFPYVAELQSGGWPWWPPLGAGDRNATTLNALMHGARGANFYMLVERERWYGSPIANDGTVRAGDADWFRQLNAAVSGSGLLGLRRFARVAVICPRVYWNLVDLTDFLSPCTPMLTDVLLPPAARCREETFGFSRPPQVAGPEMFEQFCASLDRCGVPYEIVDSGCWDLDGYEAVLCPTLDLIDAGLWQRLIGRAETGGIVVIGPEVPRYDERLRALETDAPLLAEGEAREETTAVVAVGAGQVRVLASGGSELTAAAAETAAARATATLGEELVAERPTLMAPIRSEGPPAECSCFVDAKGEVQVLFVANPTSHPIVARLATGGEEEAAPPVFRDAFTGETVDILAVDLAPREIRMLTATDTEDEEIDARA